ncbi:hypothetical protein HY469_03835, partial [Candidatus Roizmanbacteria bacterium]|nr:hypothetical protein [Candidatus Roizmanbacteria bacterium]
MPNESTEIQLVLEGQYPPVRVPPKRPDFADHLMVVDMSVTRKPYAQIEYQEVPRDLYGDSDFIRYFSRGHPLPPNPRLGQWFSDLVNGMSDIGEVYKSEVSSALTMDSKNRVFQSSVHDMSGGPRQAFSWCDEGAIPKHHRLLAAIHTHLPAFMVGLHSDRFSISDLTHYISPPESFPSPKMGIVGTSEGIWMCFPPQNKSLSWTVAE